RPAVADMTALAEALELRLREKLREDLGGTYSVGVSGGVARDPYPRYTFSIDFGSAPERVDELVRVVMAEIDTVRAAGVPRDVVDKVRESARRSRETALRENGWWIGRLMDYDRQGWDVRLIPDNPINADLSSERIQAAARLYLDPARHVQVTLQPESASP
ncbi:MAG TPA: insulinase family protein, partial [Longimicrobium sp.]|nr:insulinase family protein [Longimicrobium sp.]